MYAVFQSGGKQHRVSEGQTVRLEKVSFPIGSVIELDKILMISCEKNLKIGTPFIKDSKINAEVIKQGRADKIKIIKFHRRKHYRKQQGHRQYFTDIKILNIST